jgi:hypothetical protein
MNAPVDPQPPEAPPEPPPYPFWTWEDVMIFFGMGLPCLVLSLVLVEAVAWLAPLPKEGAFKLIAAQGVGYILWFASLVLLLRTRYDAPFWESLAWFWPHQGFWRSVFQGPMLAFAVAWLGLFLQTPAIDMPFTKMLSDPASIVLIGLFATTVGPLCEELSFRGFLMPLLMRRFGVWPGILIAAAPFALLHGPQYAWSWRHLILLMLAGAAFGRVRYTTGSTAAATLTHATYNLTFFSAFLVTQNRV